MTRVIVLRPQPGASETLGRASGFGLDAVAIPLFELEPLAWRAPDPSAFDALLVTSANAIRLGGPGLQALRSLPVHAVGEATAAAAREPGFVVASVGEGGVDRLLAAIGPEVRLLHLCGEHRAEPSRAVTAAAVYRSRRLDPPEELRQAEGAVVLVHSPRAAHALSEATESLGLDRGLIRIAAISDAAAAAVGRGWASVDAASVPTDEALLALARRLCEKAREG